MIFLQHLSGPRGPRCFEMNRNHRGLKLRSLILIIPSTIDGSLTAQFDEVRASVGLVVLRGSKVEKGSNTDADGQLLDSGICVM